MTLWHYLSIGELLWLVLDLVGSGARKAYDHSIECGLRRSMVILGMTLSVMIIVVAWPIFYLCAALVAISQMSRGRS